MSRLKGFAPARAQEPQVARKTRDSARRPCPDCQETLRVSQPGDSLEQEADRTANAVANRSPLPALTRSTSALQREPKGSPQSPTSAADQKKVEDALAKTAQAAAETDTGKQLTERASEHAKKIVSNPAGAATVAIIAGGAVAGLAAKNERLPFQPPAIPLGDSGLKAGLRYEGPLRTPDYVGLSLSGPLPGEPRATAKKEASRADYRAETARLRAELERWRPAAPYTPPPGAIAPLAPRPTLLSPPDKNDLPTKVQRKARTSGSRVSAPVADVFDEAGDALDAETRAFMEAQFGRDFSAVRVHVGGRGSRAADALDARAFTLDADIAFAAGEYHPASESGRRLLAHELAHVVQQGAAPPGARTGAATAHAPTAAATPTPVAATVSASGSTTVARATKPATKTAAVKLQLPASGDLPALTFSVTPAGTASNSEGKELRNFEVDRLAIPATKGPKAEAAYTRLAQGGALASTVQVSGDPQAALWQKRASTSALRKRWLDARGWPSGSAANKYWQMAGGEPEFPTAKTLAGNPTVCEMDHIVELQIGGNNTNENIQALDEEQNRSSGGTLWTELSGLAKAIADEPALAAGDATQIRMQFRKATLQGQPERLSATCKPAKPTCLAVEKCADKVKVDPADKSTAGTEPYPLTTEGGHATELKVPLGFSKNKNAAPLSLELSDNRAAEELIPGFLLLTLRHAGPRDQMDASIDTRGKTRLPLIFDDATTTQNKADKGRKAGRTSTLVFDVTEPQNRLRLAPGFKKLAFQYPYLSPGEITKLMPTADGVDFVGTITPTVPFLGTLDIAYERGTLSVTKGLKPDELKPPIPGAKITEASVGIDLAPDLKARGKLAMEYAPRGKKVLDASITVSADADGLTAKGDLDAYLPGIDKAHGSIAYSRANGWTGGAKASAANLKQKFKYARDGEVEIGLRRNTKGETSVDAHGTVTLDLPHTNGITAELENKGGRWLFRGRGSFDVPRLKPIDLTIEYDGTHLSGEAKNVGFQYKGLDATLDLKYFDEKFSGSGKLAFDKGRVAGRLQLSLLPSGRFTGDGSVTLQIKEGIEATGGISLDQNETVQVKGRLAFAKPIPLFEGFGGDTTLLETGFSIPIPGASIGTIGLKARIEGALKAGYHIGPGEIRNAAVETAFNPLEDRPDFSLTIGGQVWIGASAYISGSISGDIVLDVGIAEASGGLRVTATAKLNGEALSKVSLTYQKANFEVSADFAASIALAIRLALDAHVKASAGIGPFKVDTEKRWELAAREFNTGLTLGLKVAKPLKYRSDTGLETPSLSDVQITKPQLDAAKLLRDVFGAASGKEEQAP